MTDPRRSEPSEGTAAQALTPAELGRLLAEWNDTARPLPELTLAQKWDLTANELARNVHTHPTMSEALQECFHGLIGHMINF